MVEADGRPTAALRAEHGGLRRDASRLARVASKLGAWSVPELPDELSEVRGFLSGRFAPHAAAEETVLYPMMDKVMGVEQATATMVADHRAIRQRADALGELIGHVGVGPPSPAQTEALREHLYGLWAIVDLHLDKEERVLFTMLDDRLTPADTRTLIERMESFG